MNSQSNQSPFQLLVTLLIVSFSVSYGQPANFWSHYCGTKGNYTNNSSFATNLNMLLSSLASATPPDGGDYHFYNLTAGTKAGGDFVSLEVLCRGDMALTDCHACYSDAAWQTLRACPTQKEAFGWYRGCTIRYSDHPIAGTMESSPWYANPDPNNVSDSKAFDRELRVLLRSLKLKAAGRDRWKWAYGSRRVNGSHSVYAMMQCTPDLNASSCSDCIQDMIDYAFLKCYGRIGCDIGTPNCDMRFEIYQFFRSVEESPSSPSSQPEQRIPTGVKGHSKRKIKSSQLSALIAIPTVVAIVVASGAWICYRWRKAMQTADKEIEEVIEAESLQFDLNTIKAATSNFSLDNKLGQGGFGEVYKGKLGSGQEVAVKRLSKTSGQGIAEFKTEVVLVAKLQHKNLVKLLGFCMSSKEKLLVYEFLPNSSLDRLLFDPSKSTSLDWKTRFVIILGIARGLLYLHEDSRLKVIHRDLKSSNILLDESMNPKISDFGLAKLFGMDQTQGDTGRIVGTYGYMAPEYAMTGHFSVKSDVYSFGMMVLEIVSAQKNGFARPQDEEPLVYRAWRLWNEEKVLDLVDPVLENNYQPEEVIKCIHIGLLSIQEDPVRRPRMNTIVAILNGDSINLPMPKAPQFLGNPTSPSDETASNPCTMTVNITDVHPR